jgi:hypothetical protein
MAVAGKANFYFNFLVPLLKKVFIAYLSKLLLSKRVTLTGFLLLPQNWGSFWESFF